MLKKLIKHEWKSTYKIGLILLGVVGGITLLGILGIVLPIPYIMKQTGGSASDAEQAAAAFLSMMLMLGFMLYMLTLMGVTYAMLGYQGVHFYKTMYTDEGYLTHTLPMTPKQIFFGKTVVAGCWNLIIILSMILSGFILIVTLTGTLTNQFGTMYPWIDMQKEFADAYEDIVGSGYAVQMVHVVISIILMLLISPFCSMLMLFGGLTIGQLSRKYKALMGILAYVGILFVNSIISQIVNFFFTMAAVMASSRGNYSVSMTGSMDSSLIVMAIMGTVMYFLSLNILSKKLNLD